MKTATILMAWELGGGQGHIQNFRRLAERLRKRRDYRIVAAVRDLRLAWILADHGVEVVQAPAWPATLAGYTERPSSATFTDVLAYAGLADPDAVLAILRSWLHLFRWVKPDLVITDYAPLAALAGRGRIPLMQTGIGFTLPPATLDRLPRLHTLGPPVWSDEEVLGIVNGALLQLRSPPLIRLADLFDGDDIVVTTFPMLDPYAHARSSPAGGPLIDGIPAMPASDAKGLFAYLHPPVALRADIRAALQSFAPVLEVFVPGLDGGVLNELAEAGAHVHWQPPPLAEVLCRRRLVLHQGGAGVAAEALAAGVPQLLLTSHIEQDLNAKALAQAGVARSLSLQNPAVTVSADGIAAALEDRELLACARIQGERHRAQLQSDPLGDLIGRCENLIRIG